MARKKKPEIRSIPSDTLECRDYQHAWVPYDGGRRGSGWFRVLRCQRCKVKRHQNLLNDGSIQSTWYDYADNPNYLVKGGRLTAREKNAIRLHDLKKMEK